jgi:hypothetical protein
MRAFRLCSLTSSVAMMLASCTTGVTDVPPPVGAKAAAAPSHATLGSCPDVTFENASPAQRKAAEAALADACDIVWSEAFRTEIAKREDWLAGCRDRQSPVVRPISSADLQRVYPAGITDFKLRIGSTGSWFPRLLGRGAWATTSIYKQRITILPSRINGWIGGKREDRANLINTLVHEMTHLVPREGATLRNLFTDRGNGTSSCPRARLVSYELGRQAELIWLATHPAAAGAVEP